MSSKARSGAGAILKMGDGASVETFNTVLTEILTLNVSGEEFDEADVTNFDSALDANGNLVEEVITTLLKAGQVQFTANYIPNAAATGQEKFREAFDGKAHNWKLVLPNDPAVTSPLTTFGTWAFAGFIKIKGDFDLDPKKPMQIKGTIRRTGPSTFTYHT